MASSSRTTDKFSWWLMLPFGVVVVAWGVCWLTLVGNPERGTFGDMFGSVNALFSGLAFAGLIIAIRLQSQELALQREELAETRAVLQDQKTQMEAQATTLQLQQFEATFFQLLRTHNDLINSIDLRSQNGLETRGRDCMLIFYRRLENQLESSGRDRLSPRENVLNGYKRFYENAEHELGHYFRHLYHIIKFVDSSDVQDKRRYTSFVRAQISSYESLLLFFNCISPLGSESFKPLVEKYGLLKHMPRNKAPNFLLQAFQPAAYLSSMPDATELASIGAKSPKEYQASAPATI